MPRYAQHFLINPNAVDRIIESLDLSPDDRVVEIGPGKGVLTKRLAEKAGDVTAIEVDPEMVKRLLDVSAQHPGLRVVHADVLKFDFRSLAAPPYKVVGNLPYNLTSPILRRLCDWDGWRDGSIMVQKEVADRLCAAAGSPDYGALTAGVRLNCETEMVFVLGRHSFSPPPKVESAVVKLRRRATPLSDNIPAVQRVIQAAFQQRRKTLLNSLSHGLGIDKSVVQERLEKIGVDPGVRPETLEVEVFIRLSAALLA